VPGGRRRRGHSAAGEHHLRVGQAGVAGALREPVQVAREQGGEGGVDHGGGKALVFAKHARHLVGERDVHVGQLTGDHLLVLGVAKAPQQAHAHGLDVARQRLEAPRQLVSVEFAQHAIGPATLWRLNAQLRRDHGRRVPDAEPVELGPRLAPELLQVGEALGGDQRGARGLALQQSVGAHRHTVHEALHVGSARAGALERLFDRGHHALRLVVRRGGRLASHDAVGGQQDGVGEGAAHIHPENHGGKLPGPRSLLAGGEVGVAEGEPFGGDAKGGPVGPPFEVLSNDERRPKPPLAFPLESPASCTPASCPGSRSEIPWSS
jgi:hypothetical protein